MRTTIRIDDHLLTEAKKIAAERRTTLTEVIEESLREMLARKRKSEKKPPIKLKTYRGNGLQPGVDLDDSAALLDIMESKNDTF